jgi:hypothetical protein
MEKFRFSTPLSPDELARLAPAAFTTLPVRINRQDQQARKISSQFVKAWRDASQQSPLSKQSTIDWERLSSSSPIGHLASLVHPGCRPQLLFFMAKVFDYAQIHHGMYILPDSVWCRCRYAADHLVTDCEQRLCSRETSQ